MLPLDAELASDLAAIVLTDAIPGVCQRAHVDRVAHHRHALGGVVQLGQHVSRQVVVGEEPMALPGDDLLDDLR